MLSWNCTGNETNKNRRKTKNAADVPFQHTPGGGETSDCVETRGSGGEETQARRGRRADCVYSSGELLLLSELLLLLDRTLSAERTLEISIIFCEI